ncbi:hypothetical protein BDV35DRAFT_397800 [Aspergillus flavus]|nr:uncharacterized protein G4B84_009780 [Aspergillus flavus NRRL3357]KAB8241348.1 hypothetical protein BDV35DRAFT_397800 [Aspergillus flavus]OOO09101.1 hypothetical protein OAory_01103970 [Aspergillus oryzae]KAF7622345.1 hypothetical protein AFLA_008884 [Aspergillus flavus NRRL3357]KAJ1714477.1 hypothetical protein NYO67_3369 [Aspergillus flavus]QMW34314.1 hypothetical protein G4B84_009780 [Aspergillus flavus NRRL3357]
MALLAKASSLACLLVLAFLALASISHSRPVTEISRSGTLHARDPDPRLIPGSNDLVSDILDSIGLQNFQKLNNWKQNQATDESSNTAPTKTQQNNTTPSSNHTAKQTTPSGLADPAGDPSGFVSGLLRLLSDRFKQAWHSSDEHTLT